MRGPTDAATPPAAPIAPTAVERRRVGKASSTRASEAGDSMARPAACTTRAATSNCTVGAIDTSRLPTTKIANPVRNTWVRP